MTMPSLEWTFSDFVALTHTLVTALCSVVVYAQNRHSRKNRATALYGLSLLLLASDGTGFDLSTLALFWIPVTALHLNLTLFGQESPHRLKILKIMAIVALILSIAHGLKPQWPALHNVAFIFFVGAHFFSFQSLWTFRQQTRDNRYVRPILTLLLVCLGLSVTGALVLWRPPDGSPFFAVLGLGPSLAFSGSVLATFKVMFIDIKKDYEREVLLFLIYAFLMGLSFPFLAPLALQVLSSSSISPVVSVSVFSFVFAVILTTGAVLYSLSIEYEVLFQKHLSIEILNQLKLSLDKIHSDTQKLKHLGPDRFKDSRSQTTAFVNLIHSDTALLEEVVLNLLDLREIYERKTKIQKKEFRPKDLAQEAVRRFTPVAQEKGLTLHLDAESTAPIQGDEGKIRHILSHLLHNAIRFSEKGLITVQVRQLVGEVQCSVVDSGVGISFENLLHIFERRFYYPQFRSSIGLRLAVCHGWIAAHGGKIWLESQGSGHGTKATFILPHL